MTTMRGAAALMVLLLVGTLSSCGLRIPADPDGSLDAIVSSGELRAGYSPAPDLIDAGDPPVGPLADLLEGFAREHGADVDWIAGSEETLVDGLETGDIDVAVGGMTDATPWTDRASATRGFRVAGHDDVVVLLPLGENALQVALETYLDQELSR